MKNKIVPQCHLPGPAVVFHAMTRRHLRRCFEAALRPGHSVECIEHEIAVTAGDARRGQDRIEHCKIGLRYNLSTFFEAARVAPGNASVVAAVAARKVRLLIVLPPLFPRLRYRRVFRLLPVPNRWAVAIWRSLRWRSLRQYRCGPTTPSAMQRKYSTEQGTPRANSNSYGLRLS